MHEPQPFLRSAVRLQLCHTHSPPPDKQRRGPPRQGGLEVDGEATTDPATTEPHPSLEAATRCAESRRRRGGRPGCHGAKGGADARRSVPAGAAGLGGLPALGYVREETPARGKGRRGRDGVCEPPILTGHSTRLRGAGHSGTGGVLHFHWRRCCRHAGCTKNGRYSCWRSAWNKGPPCPHQWQLSLGPSWSAPLLPQPMHPVRFPRLQGKPVVS